MSDHEIAVELDKDGAIAVSKQGLQVLDELLKHLFQDLKLDVTVRGQNVLGNSLVGWKHTIESGRVVSAQDTGCLLELALADVLSGELSEELVENLLVLLLSDRETLVPSTFLRQKL